MSPKQLSTRNRALLVVSLFVLIGGPFATISAVGASAAADASNETEEPYVEEVPEEGDEYFEMADPDGEWVSYINPRDWYRDPMLGDGSGKLCVTLLNEEGEVIAGESVPGTTVTVETAESLHWHPDATPMVVEYPLTEHYDRPLDSDQFGTSPDQIHGDGYLDAHCIEWHGLSDHDSVAYGEPTIEGDHADRIEVVGYIQQDGQAWNSDVDPIEDAVPYDETSDWEHEDVSGWTYDPPESHGQVVIVLQVRSEEETGSAGETTMVDRMPGLGPIAAIVAIAAILIGTVARARR